MKKRKSCIRPQRSRGENSWRQLLNLKSVDQGVWMIRSAPDFAERQGPSRSLDPPAHPQLGPQVGSRRNYTNCGMDLTRWAPVQQLRDTVQPKLGSSLNKLKRRWYPLSRDMTCTARATQQGTVIGWDGGPAYSWLLGQSCKQMTLWIHCKRDKTLGECYCPFCVMKWQTLDSASQ